MGAVLSTYNWKQPNEKQIRQAKQNQRRSFMIQQLSKDVDAQYHCFQPYLLLNDIIHLHFTCRIWCHWIRSPGSIIHRSRVQRRTEGFIITLRDATQLFHMCHTPWIQSYLYRCRISPPLEDRSNRYRPHSQNNSCFKYRLKSTPPLLQQLAELKQIQHLTLDHIHPSEITRERIQAYFMAVAPTLRSFELFPTINSSAEIRMRQYFGPRLSGDDYTKQFLEQLHLLTSLEELRIYVREGFCWSGVEPLSASPNFHTFICKNELEGLGRKMDEKFALSLAKCRQLKHCSFGVYSTDEAGSKAGTGNMINFLLARHQVRQSLPVSYFDPLEYFDLSTIRIQSRLWKALTEGAPNLTYLDGYYNLEPEDWSLLKKFERLKYLHITMARSYCDINDFVNDLIECPTIEALTLANGTRENTVTPSPMTEAHVRSILSHLTRLTNLTLSQLIFNTETVAGFSEPNQLLSLTFDYCRAGSIVLQHKAVHPFYEHPTFPVACSIRESLPTLPTLTHLRLFESPSPMGVERDNLTRDLFQRQPHLATAQFAEGGLYVLQANKSGTRHVLNQETGFFRQLNDDEKVGPQVKQDKDENVEEEVSDDDENSEMEVSDVSDAKSTEMNEELAKEFGLIDT